MNSELIREYRKVRQESQYNFWSRFGVTQSRGSRFETGAEMPSSVEILLRLYLNGVITDNDL
ncbi:MAG: helix-turn-helix transcriptional regulator [Nitrosomonadales bacterium]|nr:helix-turn-helix transcriptional regulator [Nitrosomonadales bacterium]